MAHPPLEGDSNTTVTAVYGRNTDSGNGVIGESQLAEGVRGISHNPNHGGVVGVSDQNNGIGVFGTCDDGKSGVVGTGVWGKSRHWGVLGESQDYEGVRGISHNPNHGGVVGICDKPNGIGVFGFCDDGSGNLVGTGVWGKSSQGEGVHGETNSTKFAAVAGIELNTASNIAAVYGEQRGGGPGVFGTSANGEGVHGQTNSATFAAVAGITLNPNGTGAGVYGESRGKGPAGFFKGDVVVTGDIFLPGADCAEQFDVAEAEGLEPGTVVVINGEGSLRESDKPYDKRVAGVISGAGEYKTGIVLDRRSSGPERAPVALVGKAYCKVDAAHSPIEVGDLLTTSTTPGHAMKASDRFQAFGSVIGKALRPIKSGKGLIPILIALQ